jgi:orotate phosphoribosyltransferase
MEENGYQLGGIPLAPELSTEEQEQMVQLLFQSTRTHSKSNGNLALCSVPGKKVRLDGKGVSSRRAPIHR